MKKIVLAALSAFVSFGAFAMSDDAHTANHKWVRKYVAEMTGKRILDAEVVTNASGTVTITAPFSSTNVPDAVAISMTFSANTNEALRLDNSTIPGMTNRTYFAYDYAQSGYANTNAPIRMIYASKVTTANVTTNVYDCGFTNVTQIATNRVTETRFSATGTNGTAFVSFKTNGVYWIRAATNAAWKARITRTKVSDAKRGQLIGTPLIVAVRRFSFWDLFFPSAYADTPPANGIADDGTITWSFTLESITITYKDGSTKDVDVSALSFDYSGQLPEKPDGTHTCANFDKDCNCEGFGKSYADIENNPAYDVSQYSETVSSILDFSYWITKEEWKAVGGKVDKKGNWYIWTEDGEDRLAPNDFMNNDAWNREIDTLILEIATYLSDCNFNYKKSFICNKDNPQHIPGKCGSADICCRNPDHLGPHEYNSTANNCGSVGHSYTCKCGYGKQKYEKHSIVGGGEKKYDKDSDGHITGWKIPGGRCSKCPYSTPSTVHTCLHIYCGNCEGGDDCNLPCQYCNGAHNFSTATDSRCALCQCPNCGVHSTLVGEWTGVPSSRVDRHGGFGDCGNPDHDVEPENERGGGGHCVCQCGYNSCWTSNGVYNAKYGIMSGCHAESCHVRESYASPRYEDSDDGIHHWKMDKSACTNPGCGDPYGAKEKHEYSDDADSDQAGKATYVDNEHCKWVKTCTKEGCGHKKSDANHSHVALGDVIGHYFHTSNEVRYCNHEFTCKNCQHSFYEDVATSSNACGNVTCSSGHLDGTPTHKDYTDNEDSHDTDKETGVGGTHTCACGGKTEDHHYGPWMEASRSNGSVTYVQICSECQHEHTETKDDGTAPTGGIFFPVGGCCGAWIMGVPGDNGGISNYVWKGGTMTNWVRVCEPITGLFMSNKLTVVEFPTAHHFGWRDTSPRCMVCTNMNPLTSAICGTNSTDSAGHCGWHDVNGLCTCECAYTNLAHVAGVSSNEWIGVIEVVDGITVTNCYEKLYCDRQSEIDDHICGAVTNVLGEHAWADDHVYVPRYETDSEGATNCYCCMKQTCKHCDEGGYPYADAEGKCVCGSMRTVIKQHHYLPTGVLKPDVSEGATNEYHHLQEQKCDHYEEIWQNYATGASGHYQGCHHVKDVEQPHTMTDWEFYAYVDLTNHKMRRECYDPATSNGCGFVQYTNEAHTVQTLGPWMIAGDMANHAYTNTCAVEGCSLTNGWTGAHVFSDERWAYNSTVHWTEIACTGGVTGAGCNLTITNSTPEVHIGCCTNCICGFVTDHLALTNIVTATNKYCQASLGGGAPGCGALITGKVYTHHCNKCGEDIDQSVEWDPHECINGVKVWGDGVFSWACPENRSVNGYSGPGGSVQCDLVTSVSSTMSAYDWPPTSNTCASATFSGMFFSVASNGWYTFECTCDDNGEFFGSKSYWVPKQNGVAGHTQNEAKSYYLYGGKAYALDWSASSDSGLFSFSIDKFAEPCAAPKNSRGGLSLSTSSVGGGSSSTPTNGVYTTIRSITPLYDGETGAPLTE